MFAYVASVTLHEHFMNALNAENVSVDLEKAKNTISGVSAFVVSVVWVFCFVLFYLVGFSSYLSFPLLGLCLRLFTFLK